MSGDERTSAGFELLPPARDFSADSAPIPTTTHRPTFAELLPRVNAYYRLPGNSMGGSLHIVLEDDNVNDHHVQWCIDDARKHGDEEGALIGELLLKASKRTRLRLAAEHDYPWSP